MCLLCTQPCVFYFPSRLKQTKIRVVLYDEVNRGYKYHHDITYNSPGLCLYTELRRKEEIVPIFLAELCPSIIFTSHFQSRQTQSHGFDTNPEIVCLSNEQQHSLYKT